MLSLRTAWSRAVVSGLINCTSQAGAILRPEQGSAKGTVPAGTGLLGANARAGAKAPCSLANEAALRGSQRWPVGPSPWGIDSGCPPCAAPQWRSHLGCAVYVTRHPQYAPGADLALPHLASHLELQDVASLGSETSGLQRGFPQGAWAGTRINGRSAQHRDRGRFCDV